MTDQINRMVEETKKESFIMIKFDAPGSTEFTIYFNNATPAQSLAAAEILRIKSESVYMRMEMMKEEQLRQQQLSVPRPEILIPK